MKMGYSPRMRTLYQDGSILITDLAITISDYYFPTGNAKVIPWSDVKSVTLKKMGVLNGKYRAWGMGLGPVWFYNEWRAKKDFLFIVDTGKIIKSALTPDDVEAAKKAIEQKISIRQLL